MRILFVADGRSPTTLTWLRYWIERGDEVFLASTFACTPDLPLRGLDLVPVAFSKMRSPSRTDHSGASQWLRDTRLMRLRLALRQWVGILTLPPAARRLEALSRRIRPDLVHALRIPYEGMLAAHADLNAPLVISVWGNDFTLHAPSTPWMRLETRRTMLKAAALHVDCQRDLRLAGEWGFALDKPALVIPGNGGVHTDIFFPLKRPPISPVVVNPRGFRSYIRNDTFFRSIPLVLAEQPEAHFRCASMAGIPEAEAWVKKLGVEKAVELLTPRPQKELAEVLRAAQVAVSPSTHDGTPNSLLEAMACGCFPVAGNLESIREWITPGENGLLIDPSDPAALAEAILTALGDEALRTQAVKTNIRLVAERAEFRRCLAQAEAFYKRILGD